MMKRATQRHAISAYCEQTPSEPLETPPSTAVQPVALSILRMLEPHVEEAHIALRRGVKVLIRRSKEPRIIVHCGNAQKPCSHHKRIEGFGGEAVSFCKNLADNEATLVQLQSFSSKGKPSLQPHPKKEATRLTKSTDDLISVEDVAERELLVERLQDIIQDLSAEEKANLLSAFEEEAFSGYLEKNCELETIQSIQYQFTKRINVLKKKRIAARRVIEQRKVGDFLYKLQPGQKGGNYWYLQYTKNGKRHHVYLGKEENRPAFNPDVDLAKKKQMEVKVVAASG